jgi:hypothetical protein
MVHVVVDVVQLFSCGCEVATYAVIGESPFEEGFDQLTRALPRPALA